MRLERAIPDKYRVLLSAQSRILKLATLLLVAVGPGGSPRAMAQSSEASPVVVETVIEAQVNTGYRVVGSVVPLRTTTVGAPAGGRVAEFSVDVGRPVKKGQVLAKLQTGTLEIELAAANAELELYRQQLAEVQNGSRVEDIAEAEANATGAEVAMQNAENQLRRLQTLATTRAATAADLDDARERSKIAKSAFAAAQALLTRIKQGPRKEQIAQRQAQVELQQQNVRLIEDRIEKHTILAPFDGFISSEYTEIGAWIMSGDPVAQVIQIDEVEVVVPVTANYVSKLTIGDTIRIEFPSMPDRLMTGTIDRVVPLAETRSRTYPVYIRLKNELRAGVPVLMAGMLARVDLPAGAQRLLPLVPKDALVLNEDKRTVFVVEPDASDPEFGTVRKVDVSLGIAQGSMIQVEGQLAAGQQVVVVGNERLLSGDRVRMVRREDPPSDGTAEG